MHVSEGNRNAITKEAILRTRSFLNRVLLRNNKDLPLKWKKNERQMLPDTMTQGRLNIWISRLEELS